MVAVCSDENESVEREKIIPAHNSAGHHERKKLRQKILRRHTLADFVQVRCGTRIAPRLFRQFSVLPGPSRELSVGARHFYPGPLAAVSALASGCHGKPTSREKPVSGFVLQTLKKQSHGLFHSVVRSFARDHHVMYMRFAQASSGDAYEAALLA